MQRITLPFGTVILLYLTQHGYYCYDECTGLHAIISQRDIRRLQLRGNTR